MTTINLGRRSATIQAVIDTMTSALRIIPDQIVRLTGRSGLQAYGPSLNYLLLDRFYTDRAAGAINGTVAEPGGSGTVAQNTRTVNDTGNALTISGGLLQFASGTAEGNPAIWYGGFTRTAGRLMTARVNITALGSNAGIGWDNDQSGSPSGNYAFVLRGTTLMRIYDAGTRQIGPSGTLISVATDYDMAIVLRATGAFFFLRGGIFTQPTLMWISSSNATPGTPLYPVAQGNATNVHAVDYVAVPDALWLPSPSSSDAFTRSDGALGSTDGAGHAEANGGSGLAWTAQVGTWAIASNAAGASALAGGLALATVDTGKADVMHDVKVTRSGGVAGAVVRYVDANNYIVAYHDGTNAKLDKVLAGVTTNVISAAATYSAGAVLRVVASGSAFELYYNGVRVNANTISDAALQSATKHGIYTTDTANRFDDMATWPRGTAGEWSALQSFFQA